MIRPLLCLCLFLPLFGDDITSKLPEIWNTECYICRPFQQALVEIEDQVVVDLIDPCYEDGVLTTDSGGILSAPGLRIQAEEFIYTRKLEGELPIYTVQCRGNLLIDYEQWVLVGDFLYYDFLTHRGYLINGKTAQPPWYVSGEEVLLLESGELVVLNGSISTSEGGSRGIVIETPTIELSPDRIVTASNLRFRVNRVPLFWLPQLKVDLDNFGTSPFALKFGWGGFMGSHLSLLYQFLALGEFKGFARLDAFFGHGPGGGIETRYNPKFRATEFYTRSYYAHDIAISDRRKRDRYRFQGTLYDCIRGVEVKGRYDFVSDAQMAADFELRDFELKTAGKTELNLRSEHESWIGNLFARVRVNDFQSVDQQLPTLALNWHPFEIPGTGILIQNDFSAGYLNYVFSDDVVAAKDFDAGRVSIHPFLYRPFFFGPVTFTPEAGLIGIAYSNSPGGGSAGQAVGELGLRLETSLSARSEQLKHVIEPYIHYRYLSHPKVSTDNHFIFSIEDGYDRLNLIRFGVSSSLFVKAPCGVMRPFWIDLWTNAYLDEQTIPQAIPKGYLNLEWQPHPRIFGTINGGWNFRNKRVDFYCARLEWTYSDLLAFAAEYRYHSPYDWRKADFYNFILDTVRTQDELLESALSLKRQIALFRTFIRLNPDWSAKIDLRKGWSIRDQPTFFEYEFQLGTVVFQHWRFNFTYEKLESDNRYSISLKLDRGPPPLRKSCI